MNNEITIKLRAESASAIKGISDVTASLDKFGSKTDSLRQKLVGASVAISSLYTAAGAVMNVIGAAVDIGKELVNSYTVQQQAEIKLQSVLTATQNAVGMSANEMLALADSLQSVTTYSDQEIIAVEQMLAATRKIGRDIMPEATMAILDMAAATGDDAAGAAHDLAQALSEPACEIESLKEKGIQLTEAQAEDIWKVQKLFPCG